MEIIEIRRNGNKSVSLVSNAVCTLYKVKINIHFTIT